MLRSIKLFAFLLLIASPVFGQTAVMSNDYWVSFLPSLDNGAAIYLLVTTNSPGTEVKVTYTEDLRNVEQFMVDPNKPKEYRIRMSNDVDGEKHLLAKPDQAEVIQKRSVHITSTAPIAVQQFTDADNNVSLAMPMPTGYLGRTYVIAAFNDQHISYPVGGEFGGWSHDSFPRTSGEFIVIAAEDSTIVTIKANGKMSGGLLPGQTHTLKLNKGETYWMKGLAENSTNDISGTVVTSNKPIAVSAGCEVARTLDAMRLKDHFDYNDHIADYMLPVEQWGTMYLGTPLTNKRGTNQDDLWGEFYRVFAAEPTELYMDGQSRGIGTYWEFQLQTLPRLFESEKPIMVVQYDYYIDFHGINPKTPRTSNSMQVLTPMHQWVKNVSFTLPTGYEETFLYVTAHKDSIDLIKASLNGGTTWSPISGLKYSGAAVYNTGGVFRTYTLILSRRGQITIDGPCTFQVYNHGTRDNDYIKATYGYASTVASTFGKMVSHVLAVTVDSSCGRFDVAIVDTAASGDGIAELTLVNGSYRGKPHTSSNTVLTLQPHALGARSIYAAVTLVDPLKDGVAYVLARSRAGYDTLVRLRLSPLRIQASNTIRFENAKCGDTVCRTATITNSGTTPLVIDSLTLLRGFNVFTIIPSTALPVSIAAGEFYTFDVCYSPIDTGNVHWDSIQVASACFEAPVLRVDAFARVATVFADDQDFKIVDIGETRCENIEIKNLSPHVELTLTGVDTDSTEFAIDPSELSRFPITLKEAGQPGDRTNIRICYTPINEGTDTVFVQWYTDIPAPYDEKNLKDWTVLLGRGQLPAGVDAGDVSSEISFVGATLRISLNDHERIESIAATNVLGATIALEPISEQKLGTLTSGVYFIRVETSSRTFTAKIVK